MKTDDLIKALAADAKTSKPAISATMWMAAAAAIVLAAAGFIGLMKLRPDFFTSIVSDPRFAFKFVFTLTSAGAAFLLVRRLVRPDAEMRGTMILLAVPAALLFAAVAIELGALNQVDWWSHAINPDALVCITYIPLLSLAPLAAILIAMRAGAPANPAMAGAGAGLLAAAIGATFYAAHCSQDSPLFVGVWYVLSFAGVAIAGALIGRMMLRW